MWESSKGGESIKAVRRMNVREIANSVPNLRIEKIANHLLRDKIGLEKGRGSRERKRGGRTAALSCGSTLSKYLQGGKER